MSERVLVAMSGGVDSSFAALLLQEQGYECIGVTMQIWPELPFDEERDHGGCCSLSAVEDARSVARVLGIRHYVLDFRECFDEHVIQYFCTEYACGRTPNPCIACNQHVKFGSLLHKAQELEARYIATGHYAIIDQNPVNQRFHLRQARDPRKDQSYALYNLTQEQLAHTLFPLGELSKEDVRNRAEVAGLRTARKPDSQEICFVVDDDYKTFLSSRIPSAIRPGPFVDTRGKILGVHQGLPYYTVGQRKGLGLVYSEPLYVISLDLERNAVVVGTKDEVWGKELLADQLNWVAIKELLEPLFVQAKIRYLAPPVPVLILPESEGKVRVQFQQPVRAITPGQAIVFYQEDLVIGGGVIQSQTA